MNFWVSVLVSYHRLATGTDIALLGIAISPDSLLRIRQLTAQHAPYLTVDEVMACALDPAQTMRLEWPEQSETDELSPNSPARIPQNQRKQLGEKYERKYIEFFVDPSIEYEFRQDDQPINKAYVVTLLKNFEEQYPAYRRPIYISLLLVLEKAINADGARRGQTHEAAHIKFTRAFGELAGSIPRAPTPGMCERNIPYTLPIPATLHTSMRSMSGVPDGITVRPLPDVITQVVLAPECRRQYAIPHDIVIMSVSVHEGHVDDSFVKHYTHNLHRATPPDRTICAHHITCLNESGRLLMDAKITQSPRSKLPSYTRPSDMRRLIVEREYTIDEIHKELVRLLHSHGILVGWKLEPVLIALGLQMPLSRVIDMATSPCLLEALVDQQEQNFHENYLGIFRPLNLVQATGLLFGPEAARQLRCGRRDTLLDALAMAAIYDKFGRQMFDDHEIPDRALINSLSIIGCGRNDDVFDVLAPDLTEVMVGPHRAERTDLGQADSLDELPPFDFHRYVDHSVALNSADYAITGVPAPGSLNEFHNRKRFQTLMRAIWSDPGPLPFQPECAYELIRLEEFPKPPDEFRFDMANGSLKMKKTDADYLIDYVVDCNPNINESTYNLGKNWTWETSEYGKWASLARNLLASGRLASLSYWHYHYLTAKPMVLGPASSEGSFRQPSVPPLTTRAQPTATKPPPRSQASNGKRKNASPQRVSGVALPPASLIHTSVARTLAPDASLLADLGMSMRGVRSPLAQADMLTGPDSDMPLTATAVSVATTDVPVVLPPALAHLIQGVTCSSMPFSMASYPVRDPACSAPITRVATPLIATGSGAPGVDYLNLLPTLLGHSSGSGDIPFGSFGIPSLNTSFASPNLLQLPPVSSSPYLPSRFVRPSSAMLHTPGVSPMPVSGMSMPGGLPAPIHAAALPAVPMQMSVEDFAAMVAAQTPQRAPGPDSEVQPTMAATTRQSPHC